MDLSAHHVVLINTSAGKDSLAMLDHVYSLALAQGATGRLQAVHCDLGRMEWAGTRELAEKQCARYGVPLLVISRSPGSSVARGTARDVAVFHNALLHQRS
jgi:3'-phosphoadenosine 5'-phosphosulfate sulfotransferase (PAPS reductase)/FAD synthetase